MEIIKFVMQANQAIKIMLMLYNWFEEWGKTIYHL